MNVTSVFCLPLVVRKCQLVESWFWLQKLVVVFLVLFFQSKLQIYILGEQKLIAGLKRTPNERCSLQGPLWRYQAVGSGGLRCWREGRLCVWVILNRRGRECVSVEIHWSPGQDLWQRVTQMKGNWGWDGYEAHLIIIESYIKMGNIMLTESESKFLMVLF